MRKMQLKKPLAILLTLILLLGLLPISALADDAAVPTFSSDLSESEITYDLGATAAALTVSAGSTDNGSITYQWYSYTANEVDATSITNATSNSYTPATDTAGTTHYYVVATNEASDGTAASATGKTATVTVKSTETATSNTGAVMIETMPVIGSETSAAAAATVIDTVYAPNISSDLSTKQVNYHVGDTPTALTVTVNPVSDGELSYQWYSSTTNSTTDGTVIQNASVPVSAGGEVTVTYTPSTLAVGTTYYYVVFTHATEGQAVATITSAVSPVGVGNASVTVRMSMFDNSGFTSSYTVGAGYAAAINGVNTDGLTANAENVTLLDALAKMTCMRLSRDLYDGNPQYYLNIDADGKLKSLYPLTDLASNSSKLYIIVNGVRVDISKTDRILLGDNSDITVLRVSVSASKNFLYTWLEDSQGNKYPDGITVNKAESVTLMLKGFDVKSEDASPTVYPLSDVKVGTFNKAYDNSLDKFVQLGTQTTDANGSFTVSFDTAGYYLVTASGTVTVGGKSYAVQSPQWAGIIVREDTTAVLKKVVADNFTAAMEGRIANYTPSTPVKGPQDDYYMLNAALGGPTGLNIVGEVMPGASVKIDGQLAEMKPTGYFDYAMNLTPTQYKAAHYSYHTMTVTSADGQTQQEYYLFVCYGFAVSDQLPTYPSNVDSNGNAINKTVIGADGKPISSDLVQPPTLNSQIYELSDGSVAINVAQSQGYKVVAANALSSIRLSGAIKASITDIRCRSIQSDGTLGDYITGTAGSDAVSFITGDMPLDPGYNVYLFETKAAGSDTWLQYGYVTIYREKTAGVSSSTVLTPADLKFTDAKGNIIRPVADETNSKLWYLNIPSGAEQNKVTTTLLSKPDVNAVIKVGYTKLDVDDLYDTSLPVSPPTVLYRTYTTNINITVTAANNIGEASYTYKVIRAGEKPTTDNATLLYKINAESKDINGSALGNPGLRILNPTTGKQGNISNPMDSDITTLGDPLFIASATPARDSEQAKIASVGITPVPVFQDAGATFSIVVNKTAKIADNVSGGTYTIPHTGGYTYTYLDTNGNTVASYDVTYIEVIVHAPPDMTAVADKTYTFIVPKVGMATPVITSMAVTDARYGTALTPTAVPGKVNEYDLTVGYNSANLYFVPNSTYPNTLVKVFKLSPNGLAYTELNLDAANCGIQSSGLDTTVPVAPGESTIKISYYMRGSDGSDDITPSTATVDYIYHITRRADCNVSLSFGDNVTVVGGNHLKIDNSMILGYMSGESSTTVTAVAAEGRTVTVVQESATIASGTTSVTATVSLQKKFTITVTENASSPTQTYTIYPHPYLSLAPTSTYAIAPAPGQFLNTSYSKFDALRLSGTTTGSNEGNVGGQGGGSLGTFGGYVTYYYKDAIKNSGNNVYGADFSITGNAFLANSEWGAVMAAQDKDHDGKPDKDSGGNELWYELAGSLYYEDSTIHNYEITYTNPNPDFMPYIAQNIPYTDNQGNTGYASANGYHSQPYWANDAFYNYSSYPGYDAASYNDNKMTFTGTLISVDRGTPYIYGYADSAPTDLNVSYVQGNPYRNAATCFDVDWAVDKDGNPVKLDEISFIKIYNAALFDKDSTGEISPEIFSVSRMDTAAGTDTEYGRTDTPGSITIKSSGFDDIIIDGSELPASGGIYDVNVGNRAFIQLLVGSNVGNNVIVNNERVYSNTVTDASWSVTTDSTRLIRVLVQSGTAQPYTMLLKLSGTATAANTALTGLTVQRNGTKLDGPSRIGLYDYRMTVPSNYGILQIVPKVKNGATVTINGNNPNEDGFVDVKLAEAGQATAIIIETVYNGITETTTLKVEREKESGPVDKSGTVTIDVEKFTLGQGLIVEPEQVTFNKGDTAADVTKALLTELYGSKGYISNNNSRYGFYLSDIYDPDRGGLNIPSFITTALTDAEVVLNATDSDPDYLGEFDYTYTSGWMITVNNRFIPVSAGAWELNDGDVIRWQFTLYGLGADVGNSSPDATLGGKDSIIPRTNKDDLIARIARINGMNDKSSLLGAGSNQKKYDDALKVIENLLSAQSEIDKALSELNKLDRIGTPASSATDSGTTLAPTVNASNGTAAVKLIASDLSDAIAGVKENGGTITIEPKISGTVNHVAVELPKESVSSIASGTAADLTVRTPVGTVTLPNPVLDSIAAQASGNTVTVSIGTLAAEKLTAEQQKAVGSGTVYDISVLSGTSPITSFEGANISIALPYTLRDGEDPNGVAVWYLSDAGELKRMAATYDKAAGLATFETSHLSYYVVGYEASWTNPYADVKSADWFYNAVKYVSQKNLMQGTGAASFEPNSNMTRAMLVTVLYRLEGKPAVSGTSSFTDVKSGEWYTDAIHWASANKIVSGYGDGLFGTNDSVTREQMAVILMNYAKYKGYDVTKTTALKEYTDAASIDSWAVPAMTWAVAEGLIKGTAATTLSPTGAASRAQVATILMRFVENTAK